MGLVEAIRRLIKQDINSIEPLSINFYTVYVIPVGTVVYFSEVYAQGDIYVDGDLKVV
jgi:hypothetical protein